MNGAIVGVIGVVALLLGYRFYGSLISDRVFQLDGAKKTPAHEMTDGVDYVPTRKAILLGHHFASIAGLGPILGPAVAVIWGWLPGVLWVLLGSIFMGAVHDFATLVLSMRERGRSIGDLAENLLGHRARILFMIIILLGLGMVMGLFVFVVAVLFEQAYYPEAVIPVFSLVAIAVAIGILVYRKNAPIGPVTIVGVILMMFMVWVGTVVPVKGVSQEGWMVILLIYAGIASALPVWLLLQPRDYINAYQLYIGLAVLYLGLFVAHPRIVAPAHNTAPTDLPAMWPFLFVVIMCGAISGFHSLVASGTTSKQISNEKDAKLIGYGSMLVEGSLALIVILACTAGVASSTLWHQHYASWKGLAGLGPKLSAFINGGATFATSLGLPQHFAATFIAVVVVGFAMTSLDTGMRVLRFNVSALVGDALGLRPFVNRYVASLAAVGISAYFALAKVEGQPVGIYLLQLGGTTNQLFAGLALLTASVYLFRTRRPALYTTLPMMFMLATTIVASVWNIRLFIAKDAWPLAAVGGVILLLAVWLVVEGFLAYRGYVAERKEEKRAFAPSS